MKILILDDDKICRRVNSETLRRAGYETLEAASAEEAFQLLENGEPIVLIITDLTMPGVSGLEFVTRLRQDPDLAEMPIVICTCLDPNLWVAQAEPLGIAGFTPKPVNANHLRGKVANALLEERWPLEAIVRTQSRLDITPEGYFECLDAFLEQLTDCHSRAEREAEPLIHEQFASELNGLSGAARNLGAERIAEVLARESEAAKLLPAGQKISYPSVLKREQAMLNMAVTVLKNEHDEEEIARTSGRAAARLSANHSRWRIAAAPKPQRRATPAEEPPAAEPAAATSDAAKPADSDSPTVEPTAAETAAETAAPAAPSGETNETAAIETPAAEAAPKSA